MQTRHVLVLYFAFVIADIRNADSVKLIKLFLNQMGRVGAQVGEVSVIVF